MLRIAFTILIFVFAQPLQGAVLTADITALFSSQTGLSFTASFIERDAAKPTASGRINQQPSLVALLSDDSTGQEAGVVCFIVPPGTRPRLVASSLSLGRSVAAPGSVLSGIAEIDKVRLIEPVSIRGLMIGKVRIPLVSAQGGKWYQVTKAKISINFDGIAIPGEPITDSPFSRMLSKIVLNWETAKSWGATPRMALAGDSYNPFASSTSWMRITTHAAGVYAINRTNLSLAGVDVAGIDPATFRLFNRSGKRLPTRNSTPRDSLMEIAVNVFDDDGIFSGDDFIMFYATGSDFWEWSEGMVFNQHPYYDRNVFYLTWGGSFDWPVRRMATVDGVSSMGTTDTLTDFVDHIHLEVNRELHRDQGIIFDYFNWYWKTEENFLLNFNLPSGLADAANQFRVKMRAESIESQVDVNNEPAQKDSVSSSFFYFTTEHFSSDLNQLDFSLVREYGKATLTDFIEIYYRRPLSLNGEGELIFCAPIDAAAGEEYTYQVSGGDPSIYLIDVTDLKNQKLIEGEISQDRYSFSIAANEKSGRIFAIVTSDQLATPTSILVTQIDDLRSSANRADLIIITHDNFFNQAVEFAAYRQQQSALDIRVVKISDVYAQFSGGMVDPVAIRDFLGFAFRNWNGAAPSYCLLIGDGVYDFRDYSGAGAVNYIPPYIVDDDSTASDENFAYFDQFAELDSDSSFDTLSVPLDRGVDMVVGRWPIKSSSEFQVVADKMKSYESGGSFGRWRNEITLIADDEHHGSYPPEDFHTKASESLTVGYIPASFDLNRIYAVDYPFGVGGEKPEAREAIIRTLNSGTLLVNYVGHGNPNLWADERLFRRNEDIPRLHNQDRLPLIFNASCSIGFFDDPLVEGMAEDFLSYPKGGAVGTVSATRLVYSRPNAAFNKSSFYYLLGDYDFTIAEAVYVAKLVRQDTGAETNDRKYIYIGDPLTRLGSAPLTIEFEKFEPDSFVALTVVEIAGVIKDEYGACQNDFDGIADISVFDNERERKFTFPPETDTLRYIEYGPEFYRGKVDVSGGRFELKFVVPKDISYGGRNARLSCYATDGVTGASGYRAPIAIGGINTDVTDTVGPEILVYFASDPAKSNGAEVNQNARITLELFDSLGINLSGEIGHAIELTIDDNTAMSYVLNDSFMYLPGSYQAGSASMHLPDLSVGEHNLKVKAWDSANNSSLKEVDFRVKADGGLQISELLCYPNPVVDGCEFSYVLSEEAEGVALKVFTLSGIKIYEVANLPGVEGYNEGIHWDGRDADGDRIANGVYIFQLGATRTLYDTNNSDDNRATATEKLIIMK